MAWSRTDVPSAGDGNFLDFSIFRVHVDVGSVVCRGLATCLSGADYTVVPPPSSLPPRTLLRSQPQLLSAF